jgi:hypothetical protein
VDIIRTSGVRTVQLTMPELLSLRALMPAVPVVGDLSRGRPHSDVDHPMTNACSWRGKGEVCLQSSAAGAVAQGGRIAGFGAYDVTDTKFSSSMGPPSCSPPV